LHIAYLSGFKRGGRARQESRGACNLIYRSWFHYYSDYSTSTFLPSIYFLSYVLPSLCILPSLYMLPLYTFLVCFLLKDGREREGERESKNKQTYLLCFLKKKERGRENKQTYLLCFLKKKERGRENKQTYLLYFLKIEGERGRERINKLIFCVF
jgi:hypothetical protein